MNGMMGNMNPMQQMMWNLMQNGMGGQQMRGMRGGMDCDEFEDCLEEYCREVASGRREVPRAFKKMLKKAWQGAREAVSGGRYDDDDEDRDAYADVRNGRRYNGRSGGRSRGVGFWDKMRKLHQSKGNIVNLNEELIRYFPNATPEEQNLLRKMATEYSEETRKILSNLMQDDED